MINDKIDHHFNEHSPIDFNIFEAGSLYQKLKNTKPDINQVRELFDYVKGLKEQIESLLNEEDEQLKVTYSFLSVAEQQSYLDFLKSLEQEINKFIEAGYSA